MGREARLKKGWKTLVSAYLCRRFRRAVREIQARIRPSWRPSRPRSTGSPSGAGSVGSRSGWTSQRPPCEKRTAPRTGVACDPRNSRADDRSSVREEVPGMENNMHQHVYCSHVTFIIFLQKLSICQINQRTNINIKLKSLSNKLTPMKDDGKSYFCKLCTYISLLLSNTYKGT